MRVDKLNFRRSFFVGVLCMVVAGITFTGCSKDDDGGDEGGGSGDIGMAVGTFKGNLSVYKAGGSLQDEYFDAVVTVSKDGNSKLKVAPKSGEDYSNADSKTFPVTYIPQAGMISAKQGTPEGALIYMEDGESLRVVTNQQSESEITFTFEGTKQ